MTATRKFEAWIERHLAVSQHLSAALEANIKEQWQYGIQARKVYRFTEWPIMFGYCNQLYYEPPGHLSRGMEKSLGIGVLGPGWPYLTWSKLTSYLVERG